jgi:hypothetical protein
MLKQVFVVLLFLALAVPSWCEAKAIKTKDFQDKTGIELVHDVDMLYPGYSNVGRVVDVDKFKRHGFTNIKAGDYVTFSTLYDGSVNIVADPTGERKSIKISD